MLGYWAYSAVRLRHLGGFVSLEKNGHDSFDWGQGVFFAVKDALFYRPSAVEVMTLFVLAAAVVLTICSLTERFPWSMHVYTLAIVDRPWRGTRLPRLQAALPAPPVRAAGGPAPALPAWLLGLVIGVLGAASVWFSLFLITTGAHAPGRDHPAGRATGSARRGTRGWTGVEVRDAPRAVRRASCSDLVDELVVAGAWPA